MAVVRTGRGSLGWRRAGPVRMGFLALVLATLGLVACKPPPTALQGTLTHAETGEPVEGIPVRVYSATDADSVVARTRTGSDGRYRLNEVALPAGTYRVLFSWDRWVGGDSWDTAREVRLGGDGPTTVDEALVPTMATVSGRVTLYGQGWDASEVHAVYPGTDRIAGRAGSWQSPPGGPETETGYYSMELPAGEVYAFVKPAPRVDQWAWTAGNPFGGYGFELTPAGRSFSFDIEYPGWVSGRVVTAAGVPVEGAAVVLVPRDVFWPVAAHDVTRSGGWIDNVQVRAGEYRVLVVPPGGPATLVGMVDGDLSSATVFRVDRDRGVDLGDVLVEAGGA